VSGPHSPSSTCSRFGGELGRGEVETRPGFAEAFEGQRLIGEVAGGVQLDRELVRGSRRVDVGAVQLHGPVRGAQVDERAAHGERRVHQCVGDDELGGFELVRRDVCSQGPPEQVDERRGEAEFDLGAAVEQEARVEVEDRIAQQSRLHEIGAGDAETFVCRAHAVVGEEHHANGALFVEGAREQVAHGRGRVVVFARPVGVGGGALLHRRAHVRGIGAGIDGRARGEQHQRTEPA